MNWWAVFEILVYVAAAFLCAGIGFLVGHYDFNHEIQTTRLYCNNLTLNWSEESRPASGVAWDSWDIFCVNTKDKTITEVLQTCAHEYGHTNLNLEDRYVRNN